MTFKQQMYIAGIVLLALGVWAALPIFAIVAGTALAFLFVTELMKEDNEDDGKD